MTLQVSEMFSSHMVLCHSRENPVWGTARPTARVRVELHTSAVEGMADQQGRWCLWIPTPPAGTLTTLRVECEGECVVFYDVAAGEVWLAGGQSNMEMPVMCAQGGAALVKSAPFADVRIKSIARRCGPAPQEGWHFYPALGDEAGWERARQENVALFSAVGYGFAAMLSGSLRMPVGIIGCNWGGTKIQCWMPTQELLAHEDTRLDLAQYHARRAALGAEAQEAFVRYQQSIQAVRAKTPDFIARNLADPLSHLEDDVRIAFPPEGTQGDPQQPGCLYDHMVARVAPFGIRGVLWYQGESNALRIEADRYAGLFARMLKSWRRAWQGEALPFLTCQLPGFDPSRWGDGFDWPALRRQQALCARLPGVSMAVLCDLGERANIHPPQKIPVAQRLHALALEDVYEIPADAHEPKPLECGIIESAMRLRFDRPVVLQKGEPFYFCGAKGIASCEVRQIDSSLLELASPNLGPGVLRYGQEAWFVPSLYGENGLPVAPFELRVL